MCACVRGVKEDLGAGLFFYILYIFRVRVELTSGVDLWPVLKRDGTRYRVLH